MRYAPRKLKLKERRRLRRVEILKTELFLNKTSRSKDIIKNGIYMIKLNFKAVSLSLFSNK